MISIATDSAWPERIRLDVRGHEIWLNREEAARAVLYLDRALQTPSYPSKAIRLYQLCQEAA